jgi:glutamate-5-semialdehyde dehydrogenase
MTDSCSVLAQAITEQAYVASRALAVVPGEDRAQVIQAIARTISKRQNDILEANTLDLEISREMAVPPLLLEWLRLTPERLQSVVKTLERLSEVPDPIGRMSPAGFLNPSGQSYLQLMPLGVVAFIHESLPELAAIAVGLCLRTGNSIILKGGPEASQTNAVFAQIFEDCLQAGHLPAGCVATFLGDSNCTLRDLVTQDRWLNLVIPYGRPSWVEQIVRQCTAPALRTAMGNCYLQWSLSGNWETVRSMILDSHLTHPDPVNAIEKVLIHPDHSASTLAMLWNSLREKGFELRGDRDLVAEFPELGAIVEPGEWQQAYLKRIVAFKRVPSFESGIAWINQNSSGHADSLVTESYAESQRFSAQIDSAAVYINSSPRFHRRPLRGDSVFLGMSNQKGYRRGMVGLETLTTLKQVVQGYRV